MSLTVRKLQKSGFGLDTQFSSVFINMASCWLIPTKSRDHKLFKYVWHLLGNMQEVATMSLTTQGKVWKMEMLTKLGGVKKIKKCIFSLDFLKTKNMEPFEIEFRRAPCFLFLKNLKKKYTFWFLWRPNPRKSVLSRALKLTVWKVINYVICDQNSFFCMNSHSLHENWI